MKNNFILFSIIGLSILIGYFLGNENEFHYREIGGDEKINRVERLLNYIENDYVERIDTDSLVGIVIEDIVNKLDPHSVYIPSFDRQLIVENNLLLVEWHRFCPACSSLLSFYSSFLFCRQYF